MTIPRVRKKRANFVKGLVLCRMLFQVRRHACQWLEFSNRNATANLFSEVPLWRCKICSRAMVINISATIWTMTQAMTRAYGEVERQRPAKESMPYPEHAVDDYDSSRCETIELWAMPSSEVRLINLTSEHKRLKNMSVTSIDVCHNHVNLPTPIDQENKPITTW